jgi:esterase/lipase/1-acyl-sn-glycerol-3-phosphate acyltransferase
MASTVALSLTKWSLDLASQLIRADVRLHNHEAIRDDMAIIFVVNHFTRLETLLLPYVIHKHTGKEVWGLAAAQLFKGRIGKFLRSTGTVSTSDPDRDRIIVRSLLTGEHPWMIFPEGSMIKDKKVIDHTGKFSIYSNGTRRPPHTGAAVLALRAEFYRHKLSCLDARSGGDEGLARALEHFALPPGADVLSKRTVIIPVNITYFPIRARDNFLLRTARRFAKDLGTRAAEELSVEGTVLSEDTDIDITLGEPIDVREYLNAPEYAEVMACGLNDMQALETDPGSVFNDAARQLMTHYMKSIYQLTTINYDHIFATIIRHQQARSFTERAYRNRIFLCAQQLKKMGRHRLHTILEHTYRDIVFEDPSAKFQDFATLCLHEGLIVREGNLYTKNTALERGVADFHTIRFNELTEVIANEIEPLHDVTRLIKNIAQMPRPQLSRRIREFFIEEDERYFEDDYAEFYDPNESKSPDIGRPFFLKPLRPKAGIVLAHGYMAAPAEVRAMADFFYQQGYAVYGVRLRGHGTSPEDLSQRAWEDWYHSFNRGYAVVKSVTDHIIVGGFSTGGCLALIAAARKGDKVQAAFSICAPLQVNNYSVRLVPSIVTLNSLLKKLGQGREAWEYVVNEPENRHINYERNPLKGINELVKVMNVTEESLSAVKIPTLIIQASKDPIVNPDSGRQIFDKLASPHKELIMVERNRHGVVNGEGRDDIFSHVHHFLSRAPVHGIVLQSEGQVEERVG